MHRDRHSSVSYLPAGGVEEIGGYELQGQAAGLHRMKVSTPLAVRLTRRPTNCEEKRRGHGGSWGGEGICGQTTATTSIVSLLTRPSFQRCRSRSNGSLLESPSRPQLGPLTAVVALKKTIHDVRAHIAGSARHQHQCALAGCAFQCNLLQGRRRDPIQALERCRSLTRLSILGCRAQGHSPWPRPYQSQTPVSLSPRPRGTEVVNHGIVVSRPRGQHQKRAWKDRNSKTAREEDLPVSFGLPPAGLYTRRREETEGPCQGQDPAYSWAPPPTVGPAGGWGYRRKEREERRERSGLPPGGKGAYRGNSPVVSSSQQHGKRLTCFSALTGLAPLRRAGASGWERLRRAGASEWERRRGGWGAA
jgi:hypothetical protein